MSSPWQQLQQDAQQASQQTGVDYPVVLAQFVQENGYAPPASNNFGNITYTGAKGQSGYTVAKNGQKFAIYATPAAGIAGYANLVNSQYSQVATASGDAAQLSALQSSPWDAAHYPTLPATYKTVVSKLGLPDLSNGGANTSNDKLLTYGLLGAALVLLLGAVL